MSFFTFIFYCIFFTRIIFSEKVLHLLHRVLHFSLYTPRISSLFTTTFIQKWPVRMNPTHLHPRNISQNLGNLIMNVLGNLGKVMNTMKNIMNVFKRLGRHWGRMNCQRVLGMSKRGKPREKGRRRRFNLLKSLLPRGRGLKKMTLQSIEMEPWRLLPPSLRPSSPTSTTGCSSIWIRLMI